MTEKIIDSQPYNNFILQSESFAEDEDPICWGNADQTYYANDYYNSSIRQWLNNDFYNTAFTASQASNIRNDVTLNNDCFSADYPKYNSQESKDKIFLLSWDESLKEEYGFSSSAESEGEESGRMAIDTDYAKSQGLLSYINNKHSIEGIGYWFLRSPAEISYGARVVAPNGYQNLDHGVFVSNTYVGVRPACRLYELNLDTVYHVGDHIQYGNYPQSKVTDENTLALLEGVDKSDSWISYNYHSRTYIEEAGEMEPSDYMFYADIDLDGDGLRDYRAVRIDKLRPNVEGFLNGGQAKNGYTTGNIYYFKFEPIKWRVLDPDDGLIMTEKIMDSQAYNSFLLTYGDVYDVDEEGRVLFWGNADKTYYANDYYNSSIRQWLNNDFYNTAFTSSQAKNIRQDVTLNNDCFSSDYPQYNSQESKDKIFLLSWDESLTTAYGFLSSEESYYNYSGRTAQGTDYAKSQGLYVSDYSSYTGNSCWWLRSPGESSTFACAVNYVGNVGNDWNSRESSTGIRPACRLSVLKKDISKTSIDNNNGSGTETDCSNGHVDENNDGKCDRCGDAIEGFDPSANCKHICHKTGISRFFYKIALFFWKLFKINKECSCGVAHY